MVRRRTGAAVRHDGPVVAVEHVFHDRRHGRAIQVRLGRRRGQHRVEGEGAARDLRLAAATRGRNMFAANRDAVAESRFRDRGTQGQGSCQGEGPG